MFEEICRNRNKTAVLILINTTLLFSACSPTALTGTPEQKTPNSPIPTTAAPSATKSPTTTVKPSATSTPVFLKGRVTVNNLRIRSGPSTDYGQIGLLQRDNYVVVLGRNTDSSWGKILFGDVVGWVFLEYLSLSRDIQDVSVASVESQETISVSSTILTPEATPSPTAPIPSREFACVPTRTKREVGQVVRVIDGDTIEVNINGTNYTVRYIGMDTPETDEYHGNQATQKNYSLVMWKQVTLVKDVSETDRYDRLLRYVFVGDTFVNYTLVKQGFANVATYPPDTACSSLFTSAARDARVNDRGLWDSTPTLYPTATAGPAPTSGNCHPSYPTVCIPAPPPDLDCPQISFRNFKVVGSDPHRFDGDNDGIGCER